MKVNNTLRYSYYDLASNDIFIWFINPHNCIMQIEIETGVCTCLGEIPGTYGINNVYTRIMYVDSKLILIPSFACAICEYDLIEKTYRFYDFSEELKVIVDYRPQLTGKTLYKEVLYLHGRCPVIVKYDMSSHDISLIKIPQGIVSKIPPAYSFFGSCSRLIGDKILFGISDANGYILLDVNSESVEYVALNQNEQNKKVMMIEYIDTNRYVVRVDAEGLLEMQKYNLESQIASTKKYRLKVKEVDKGIPYLWMQLQNDKLYLFSWEARVSYVVSLDTDEVKVLDMPCCDEYDSDWDYYAGTEITDDMIVTIHPWTKKLVLIDAQSSLVKVKDIRLAKDTEVVFRDIARKRFRECAIINEYEELIDVKDYLDMDIDLAQERGNDITIGQQIWNKI